MIKKNLDKKIKRIQKELMKTWKKNKLKNLEKNETNEQMNK